LAGSLHLHGYVKDPTNWSDPFGLTGACGDKVIVLGEGMSRVKKAVRELRAQGVNARWYQAWGKNFPPPGVRMTPEQLESAVSRNARWLKSKIKEGYKILDIGGDGRPTRSPFYQVEQQVLSDTGHPSTHLPGY